MEKKNIFTTRDGRSYDMTISWNQDIKLTESVFPIKFKFLDRTNGRALKLPREIETFAIGGPDENIGERVNLYYAGQKEAMYVDYIEMAIRRVTDYVERGR